MRCAKSKFPIRIIVIDELELIIFVSQGLTLSTASLVLIEMLGVHQQLTFVICVEIIHLFEFFVLIDG